ncbi:MAG: homoserine kinase [Polyangiaceae bacterium]|jgi:homoserine kinase type II
MAVLTPIGADDVGTLARSYGLGKLRAFSGIAAGSVNSNFALELEGGKFFLRLYEEQTATGAGREAAMLERLAAAGVPTPAPLRRLDGALVSHVRGKAAALFPWRHGFMRCQASVSLADVERVGQALARVHIAGAGEACEPGRFRASDLLRRLEAIQASNRPEFSAIAHELRRPLEQAEAVRTHRLPAGLTHGDLFRDNVLWAPDGRLVALLDFESACGAAYAYDLMVTVLAWCVGDDLDGRLGAAMRKAYESVRPLTDSEREGLWGEAVFAALRFTITRITDYALRSVTVSGVTKDWRRFLKRFHKLQALGPEGLAEALGL